MKFLNFFSFFCMASVSCAAELPSAPEPEEQCSQTFLSSHFPKVLVSQTLQEFSVPENKWAVIASELSSKEGEVIRRVEEKAEKSPYNPLKDPAERQVALQLFRQSLAEVFSEVLMANGVGDPATIEKMLQDLQRRKALAFARCYDKT